MAKQDFNISVLTISDINNEIISDLNELFPQLTSYPPPSKKDLISILNSENSQVFIAQEGIENKKLIGCLILILFRIPSGLRARIEDVVVDKAHRRKGIGRALCKLAIRKAKAQKVRTIDLTSSFKRGCSAVNLYESLGFCKRKTGVFRIDFSK